MTEDELHDEAHENAEFEIEQILFTTFEDFRRTCRIAVLIRVLGNEFMALDDVEDVSEIVSMLGQLVLDRAVADRQMLGTVGSA